MKDGAVDVGLGQEASGGERREEVFGRRVGSECPRVAPQRHTTYIL